MSKKKTGLNWWAQQWLEEAKLLRWCDTSVRIRSYTSSNLVENLIIEPGRIEADVINSRSTTSRVIIKMDTWSLNKWQLILDVLATKAIYITKLLMDEMPIDLEDVFTNADVPLFSNAKDNTFISCSCDDKLDICRHMTTACYAFAIEFDVNPFLIFKLKGKSKSEILTQLRNRRTIEADKCYHNDKEATTELKSAPKTMEQLLDSYWTGTMKKSNIKIIIEPPFVEQSILKRLGEPTFFDGKKDMMRQLEKDYQKVLLKAMTAGYNE